jgi:hypothetical protein
VSHFAGRVSYAADHLSVVVAQGGCQGGLEKRGRALDEAATRQPRRARDAGGDRQRVTHLEAVQYAPADLRDRLMEVVDVDTSTRLTGTDSVDRTNGLLARYVPLHIKDLTRFEGACGKFLLYSDGRMDWLTGYLMQKGYQLRLLSSELSDEQISQIYLINR